jgi:hypothetical protein
VVRGDWELCEEEGEPGFERTYQMISRNHLEVTYSFVKLGLRFSRNAAIPSF